MRINTEVKKILLEKSDGKCDLCGVVFEFAEEMEVGHIVNRFLAGPEPDNINNLVGLCSFCNRTMPVIKERKDYFEMKARASQSLMVARFIMNDVYFGDGLGLFRMLNRLMELAAEEGISRYDLGELEVFIRRRMLEELQ